MDQDFMISTGNDIRRSARIRSGASDNRVSGAIRKRVVGDRIRIGLDDHGSEIARPLDHIPRNGAKAFKAHQRFSTSMSATVSHKVSGTGAEIEARNTGSNPWPKPSQWTTAPYWPFKPKEREPTGRNVPARPDNLERSSSMRGTVSKSCPTPVSTPICRRLTCTKSPWAYIG